MKNVIVEISGKSSVVALLKLLEEAGDEKYNITFAMAYVYPVYDPKVSQNIFALSEIVQLHAIKLGHTVENSYYSSENGVWFKAIKPSFVKEFSSPCINCLAYSHVCMLGLAVSGDADIVSGERLTSGKINQYKEMMDFYDGYFGEYDVNFIRPLLNETDDYIDNKYKEFCELYGFEVDRYSFPKCWIGENCNINKQDPAKKEAALSYLNDLKELMDNIKEECMIREFEIIPREEEED